MKKYMKIIAPVLLVVMIWNIKPTWAYLTESVTEVVNTFFPTNVEGEIKEELDGNVKESITVEYTGSTAGYVRIKLVPEIKDKKGNIVLNPISIDDFTYAKGDMTNWFLKDGYYYYKLVVKPADKNPELVFPFTNIKAPTVDAGCTASLTVLAQTVDEIHVEDAWGVILNNGVIES